MPERKRIALYGHALAVAEPWTANVQDVILASGYNIGNFAYVNALYQHLEPRSDVVPWHLDPAEVNEKYDIIVFACANQLGRHSELGPIAELLEKVKVPIIAIGLGAQAASANDSIELTPGTRRWVEVLADHAPSDHPNIGMRGEFSASVLEKIGLGSKCAITGCPTNLTNPDPGLPAKISSKLVNREINRVAVPAGHASWENMTTAERSLAKIVTATNGLYVAQSEIDMIQLARDESADMIPAVLERHRAYIAPELTTDDFLKWVRRYFDHYIDAPSWIHGMRKFDFVAGPRFHGVMMGIQAGVPGGVIAHDSRTMEMCETMGLPVRHCSHMPEQFTAADLKNLFPFDAVNYSLKRAKLAAVYTGMLREGGVQFDPRLDVIANGVNEPAVS
jgi:Polysaccharide pyruvyl transferase